MQRFHLAPLLFYLFVCFQFLSLVLFFTLHFSFTCSRRMPDLQTFNALFLFLLAVWTLIPSPLTELICPFLTNVPLAFSFFFMFSLMPLFTIFTKLIN